MSSIALIVPSLFLNVPVAQAELGDGLATRLFQQFDPDKQSDAGSEVHSEVAYSLSIDQDVSRMESLLDTWTSDLRKNVLVK